MTAADFVMPRSEGAPAESFTFGGWFTWLVPRGRGRGGHARVGWPERKLLRRAALELGRRADPVRVEALLYELDEVGALRASQAPIPHAARTTH